ncbi:hypothetical protein HS088_TW10G00023 [Tripterygium wilfordii]|uniref:Transcription factor MYB1R1 n=1 Tax=Tripterygium wilfordii TaxID=458696 RepID=A0A7J7D433_TRIWF|nr:transcription factor MYB1R1-like [Tripterygium wilfordii]KAF5741028.1 hypothetical protein HS088_TW10G00023 [Tripterygium wilfordii]
MMMSRTSSQCGNNGPNSPTCAEPGGASVVPSGGENGIMLSGARLGESSSSFRKSVSMNNLSQFDQPQDPNPDSGYASDDVVHASGGSRERKRGVPWTEEEHKLFLLGLRKVGKGDWRGISRNYVKTQTPTQVASHAQKYFLRRNNHNRRRRRSSLFDITTDSFMNSLMEEDRIHQDTTALPPQQPPTQKNLTCNLGGYPVSNFPVSLSPVILPVTREGSMEHLSLGPVNQRKSSIPQAFNTIIQGAVTALFIGV